MDPTPPVTALTEHTKNSLTIFGNSPIIRLARKAQSYGLTDLARYDRLVLRYEIHHDEWGSGGPRFKSERPDHLTPPLVSRATEQPTIDKASSRRHRLNSIQTDSKLLLVPGLKDPLWPPVELRALMNALRNSTDHDDRGHYVAARGYR
jgi:hypothetical protein